MTAPYDLYRDPDARKLMLEFVIASRRIDPNRAVSELRALNHVGLAHVYRDALASQGVQQCADYDPCEIRRGA